MPGDPDAPTDTSVNVPWEDESTDRAPTIPHLLITWFPDEHGRTAQAAPLDRPCWLGRGRKKDPAEGDPLEFLEQRPGETLAVPSFESTAISRRQLLFTPVRDDRVRVECVGRRELLHNGTQVKECIAAPGDTLVLKGAAVFLVESRPTELPRAEHYGTPGFPFGKADPQGLVGQSPAAWHLRESLVEAAHSDATSSSRANPAQVRSSRLASSTSARTATADP